MSELTITNWFGDIVSHPKVVVEAHSVEDVVRVLKDPAQYPSPVRAVGSNHSTTLCGVSDGGTLIKMRPMNRTLHIGTDTVTVEAGVILIDLAQQLISRKLQFYVNPEIGNLSAGSAACTGSKDGSMPGEYGQVSSYVIAVKMVLPNGDLLEVTEDRQPELMQKVRCSYGTFGIIHEVTFRVRPLTPIEVHHQTFLLKDFLRVLPELRQENLSMMYYMLPFSGRILVEFRKYNPGAEGKPNRRMWAWRNRVWSKSGPRIVHFLERCVPVPSVRYALVDGLLRLYCLVLSSWVKSEHAIPMDQLIRYLVAGSNRYTFSLFAFPADMFPTIVTEYFEFCQDYYRRKGYRSNLADAGYYISKDQQALLSYSFDGPVLTLDPVSTGEPGWREFLLAFNQFCSERNGAPLLNQTFGLTPMIVEKAFGDRLKIIADTRKMFDPNDRLLNDYFRALFA